MSGLTTHVLDLVSGRPAAGMTVELYVRQEGGDRLIGQRVTNAEGRTDEPLLRGSDMTAGRYRLVFHLGAYNLAQGRSAGIFDVVPVDFTIGATDEHYHVPLLATPFGYSTYRGS